MPDSMTEPLAAAERLRIDPRSTKWLLARTGPTRDFFFRGLPALTPLIEQTVFDRVIAEAEYQSGADRFYAVAILSLPAGGLHRLIEVAIRRPGDAWPTLCTEHEDAFVLT